jgi:hypothetical protein
MCHPFLWRILLAQVQTELFEFLDPVAFRSHVLSIGLDPVHSLLYFHFYTKKENKKISE